MEFPGFPYPVLPVPPLPVLLKVFVWFACFVRSFFWEHAVSRQVPMRQVPPLFPGPQACLISGRTFLRPASSLHLKENG
ncbi:CRISPR-associated protein Cas5 [Bacteroides fragilis]|nr:CRISPR-associated protein Cas5 [Bacteroides fragilis]MCM0298279.1 CRISPR-associated protein Cas5 [Bacteroides fragilis]